MATTTLDHNVEGARPNATSGAFDHNVEVARPNATSGAFDHNATPGSVVLLKPRELQKNNKPGQGIQAGHFDDAGLSATTKGRSILATGYFDEATATDKFAAGALVGSRIKDATVTQAKLDPAVSTPPSGAAAGDLSGSYPSPAVAKASAAFALSGAISPTSLGSNQNDYAPTGLASASAIRLTASVPVSITGLTGGAAGRVLVVHNVGSSTITLKNADTGSSAANRFQFDADVALAANQSVTLRYDATSSMWRSVSTVGSGGGGGGGTATALATSGAAVSVSGAAPPTLGQVLTSTDPTHATWQTPVAGGTGGVKNFVQVRKSSQTVNNGASDDVLWDVDLKNAYGMHPSLVGATSARLVAVTAGVHIVTWNVRLSNNPNAGDVEANILVNGVAFANIFQDNIPVAAGCQFSGSIELDLSIGDYVTLNISNGTGSTIQIVGGALGSGGQSLFSMVLDSSSPISLAAPSRISSVPLLTQAFGLPFVAKRLRSVAVNAGPQQMAFDGSFLWVTNYGAAVGTTVQKVDPRSGVVVATVTVGTGPIGVAFDGKWIWVSNNGTNNVSKIDPVSNVVVATIAVGAGPQELASDGSSIWVANSSGTTVSKIDQVTNVVTATVTVGSAPVGIVFDGTHIWVSNYSSNSASKIDPSSNTVVATVAAIGVSPHRGAFDGTHVWFCLDSGGGAVKISTVTNAALATVATGTAPEGICFDGLNLWVANFTTGTVTKIDPVTHATTNISVASPRGFAFDGTFVWTANYAGNAIQALPASTTDRVLVSGTAPSFSGVKLGKGANQSVPDNTFTAIVFNAGDTTEWLKGTDFSHNPAGAHPEDVVVNVACKVQAIVYAFWLNMPSGYNEVYIFRLDSGRNVVEAIGLTIDAPTGGGAHPMAAIPAEMDCAAGDIIQFQAIQVTGGALNMRGGAGKGWSSLTVRKIS